MHITACNDGHQDALPQRPCAILYFSQREDPEQDDTKEDLVMVSQLEEDPEQDDAKEDLVVVIQLGDSPEQDDTKEDLVVGQAGGQARAHDGSR